MVSVNPEIFQAYDIRGIYGQDFDDNFAEELGNKLAQGLKGKTYVVGRDGRNSSMALEKTLIQGMLHAGAHVYAADECTTPSFYYGVSAKKADGGIMVTASHNPQEYNGFKVVNRDLQIVGGQELMKMYTEIELDHSGAGHAEPYGAIWEYADAVVAKSDKVHPTLTFGFQGPKVSEKILSRIAEKVGILIAPINPQGIEIVFDDDADRITFFDRRKEVDPDLIALVLAEHNKYEKIVYDFRFARPIRKRFEELGIKAFPSRVGRIYMQETMRNLNADFGAELSGHYYFKDFNYLEAPEVVMLYIRHILHKTGKNLEELVKPYDTYFRAAELSYPYRVEVFETLEKSYLPMGAKISKDDGITVEFEDWWFNLRKSNTEPVMRLVVEAHDQETLQHKVEELDVALRR